MSKQTIVVVAVVAALGLGWYFFFRRPSPALVAHPAPALPPIPVPAGGANRSTKDKIIDAHAEVTKKVVTGACASYGGGGACTTVGNLAGGAQKAIDTYAVSGAKKVGSAIKSGFSKLF